MERNYSQLFSKLRPLIKLYNEELIDELNMLSMYWMPEAFFVELNNWVLNNIERDPENQFAIRIYSEMTLQPFNVIVEAFINEQDHKKTR